MSTARHQLAGAPGNGTVIDNMASRTKAWYCFTAAPATPVMRASFNCSSIQDNSAGNQLALLTTNMATIDWAMAAMAHNAGVGWAVNAPTVSSLNSMANYTMPVTTWVAADVNTVTGACWGTLA